jgi:hypothetical protein
MSALRGNWTWSFLWKGNRIQNKELSAQAALQLLVWYLQGNLPQEDWHGENLEF